MAIKYRPERILRKIAPKGRIERLMNDRMALNRAVLAMFDQMDFVSKKKMQDLALRTIKHYRRKYEEAREDGLSVKEAKAEAMQDKALLVSRIESAIIYEISQEIRAKYAGEYYTWLPSDSEEPDPEHQLNYGKTFQIGRGEMPGERYGCKCGMEIHTRGTQLNLGGI